MTRLTIAGAALLVCAGAFAFNPPEDAAGTVKLRIEAPDRIASATAPFAAAVIIENTGGAAVSGRLRVYGVDDWTVNPADIRPFSAGPGAPFRLECAVTPSPGAHNTRYPLHAEAALDAPVAGRGALHAILILEMQRPDPPRAERAVAWVPWPIDGAAPKALLRFPARRAVWQVFGAAAQTSPTGWQGADPVTGTAVDYCTQRAHPDGRDTLMMHPCWRGGAGTVLAEFALQLPAAPCRLTFANAVRDTQPGEPASDGVTFRVRVAPFDAPDGALGEAAFERHTESKAWVDGEADLSKWAGQAVRLQLESHPGPKNDTTCDESHWGNPMLVPAGVSAVPAAPATVPVALGNAVCAGQAYSVSVTPGRRGLLDGEIRLEQGDKRIAYRGLHARVLGDDLGDASGPTELVEAVAEPADGALRYRHKMRHGENAYDLVIEWRMAPDNAGAQAQVRLENAPAPRPWFDAHIEDAFLGAGEALPRDVYAGVGNVLREPQDFNLPFDSHQLATSFVGFDFGGGISVVQSTDAPPTRLEFNRAAKRCTLHAGGAQTVSLIPCANVWDGVGNYAEKIDTRKAAPGVEKLRGKMVLDLWGGRYADTAKALRETFKYVEGKMCVVVWHNWQRWGYDYRLPDIFPPNPDLGTSEEFQELVDTCRDVECIFAPHDNYIDLYPDADGFTYKNVLFWPGGEPVRAWFNEGRGAQAYRWSTDGFWPSMEKNLALLKDFCGPTGYFVDVWSSIGPYDAWTWDGNYQPATHARDAWGKAFTQIRDTFDGAPTISEGGHDQLIGSLDGSQCNHLRVDADPPKGGDAGFVWRIKCADAERVPWFDAAHHDRFSAHGAGYDPRYRAGLDPRMHGIYSDDYICTEVMDGHPPMVSEAGGWDVLRKAHLFIPMNMTDFGRGRVRKVEFAEGDLHRQHIVWTSSGYETWVNRGEHDWTVTVNDHKWILPQYGFLVLAPSAWAIAGITRIDGAIVEWSNMRSEPYSCYYNARTPSGDAATVRVRAEYVSVGANRTVEATLNWESIGPQTSDWRPFVHFVDVSGKIVFQADHAFPVPATHWTGPVTTQFAARIPENATPGTCYELRIGVWEPGAGRGVMAGTCDGERRVRLGTITVTGSGLDWQPIEEETDPYLARMNSERRMIDFGTVRTNGALSMEKGCHRLFITPLLGGSPFTVMFKTDFSPETLPATVVAEDAEGRELASVPLRRDGDWWVLETSPEVHRYSFSTPTAKKEVVPLVSAIDPAIRLEDYPVVTDQRNVGPFRLRIREHTDSDPNRSPIDRVVEISKGDAHKEKLVYLHIEENPSFPEDFLHYSDLSGEGVPTVVIRTHSGGNHCCSGCLLLELNDPVVVRLDLHGYSFGTPGNFRLRGKDILADVPDSTFAGWYECSANTEPYDVTVVVRPDGLHLDTANLERHKADISSLAGPIRKAWEEKRSLPESLASVPPNQLFETLQDMCYNGMGDDGPTLINCVWPEPLPGKKGYWERFLCQLKDSPYWDDIRELNGW